MSGASSGSASPSARIIAQAASTLTIVDADGRSLVMRRLGALDRLRLYKVIGASLGTNAPYLGIAMLAVSVCSVDGVPMPPPGTEAQLEALVARLGDAGIAAAAAAMRQLEPELQAGN